jgi:hypothetical protein
MGNKIILEIFLIINFWFLNYYYLEFIPILKFLTKTYEPYKFSVILLTKIQNLQNLFLLKISFSLIKWTGFIPSLISSSGY